MSFDACLPIILKSEGGYVVDQGGPTNLGVTQRALSAYLRRPVSVQEVRALTPDVAGPLYFSDYWNPAHCGQLPAGLDLMVFDEAVNEGVGRAISHLQEAVGADADGMFGPATLAAVQSVSAEDAINAIHDTNENYYASLADIYPLSSWGWTARNDRTRDLALAMVTP